MMNIPISNLNCWTKVTSGTGTITISNEGRSAVLDGVVGSGAQFTNNFILSSTGRVKVSMMARRIRGEGNLWIHDKDTITNRVQILSDQWEYYSIVGCPKIFSNALSSYIRVNIGVATGNDGAIEISDVKAESIDSNYGNLECVAAGVISVTAGTPTVGVNMANIKSVSASDAFNVSVSVDKINASLKTPLITCTKIDSPGTETAGKWQPRFYDKANGVILFRFFDDGATTPKALSSVTSAFSFKAEVI